MTHLDQIALHGTRDANFSTEGKPKNDIVCADGFNVSVIAGYGAYCQPRPDRGQTATDRNYSGPYFEVEVGFPTERPEPWGVWENYQDGPGDPLQSVYGYVPISVVKALIEAHGGEVEQ